MRTFSIYTLGCKVNQYESQQIREYLEGLGLSCVEAEQKPDLWVINTCCVTGTASAKSRQYIQRAGKISPNAVRVVCGCMSAVGGELGRLRGNNIRVVAGRTELPAELMQIAKGIQDTHIKPEIDAEIKGGPTGFAKFPKLPQLTSFKGHTRAFLKVQDGCDGVCSYCIVPKVRPNVQSKPVKEAVSEAKALVAAGHKEIVVTGVCLGAYGRSTTKRTQIADCRLSIVDLATPVRDAQRQEDTEDTENKKLGIADLLEELARIEGLMRIRVSSLEPGDISEELLDVFCEHRNIMPHIHLSVQSGSDRILRRMCRQYGAEELREKITMIKSRLDRPAITADIIVGFPGETEEDFQETVELAKRAGFSKMHIFPFSAREGTAGAKMKEKIQPKAIRKRAEILRRLGDELAFKFREQFVGETCEVLIEGSNDGQAFGRCERYFMVSLATKTPRHEETTTTDYTDSTDLIATNPGRQLAGAGMHKKTQNKSLGNLVPSCLGGKNEIVKVRITTVTGMGTNGSPAARPPACDPRLRRSRAGMQGQANKKKWDCSS